MKIEFDDKGYNYIEIVEMNNKVIVTLSAQGADNPRKTIVNSAEITKEQMLKLISEIYEL